MRNSWNVRKSWLVLAVVVAGVSFGIGSASAIEFGQPDGNKHPWVGLVVFYDAADVPIQQRCSGSLLSSAYQTGGKRIFLTAGHCAGPEASLGSPPPVPATARIWFGEEPDIAFDPAYKGGSCAVGGPYTGFPCAGNNASGRAYAYPKWTGQLTLPDSGDLGVVVLDGGSNLPPGGGTLAPVGYLDKLVPKGGQKASFSIVGYGLEDVKPVPVGVGVPRRMLGTVDLINLNGAKIAEWNVKISGNPGKGNGGGAICFGDSGGPLLHDSGNGEVIVGVASFVYSKNCTGPGAAYRIDNSAAQAFITNPAVQ